MPSKTYNGKKKSKPSNLDINLYVTHRNYVFITNFRISCTNLLGTWNKKINPCIHSIISSTWSECFFRSAFFELRKKPIFFEDISRASIIFFYLTLMNCMASDLFFSWSRNKYVPLDTFRSPNDSPQPLPNSSENANVSCLIISVSYQDFLESSVEPNLTLRKVVFPLVIGQCLA